MIIDAIYKSYKVFLTKKNIYLAFLYSLNINTRKCDYYYYRLTYYTLLLLLLSAAILSVIY